jgi:hypothetical protein
MGIRRRVPDRDHLHDQADDGVVQHGEEVIDWGID